MREKKYERKEKRRRRDRNARKETFEGAERALLSRNMLQEHEKSH